MPSQKSPATRIYQTIPRVEEYTLWEWYGFGYMQNWVANTVLKRRTGNANAEIVSMTIPMPMKPAIKDDFKTIIWLIFPMLMVVVWIPLVFRTTYRLTQEKELRTKESMYMMGLKAFPYWLSWFTTYLINVTLTSVLMFFAMIPIFTTVGYGLIFFQVYLYALSSFGIIMIVQSMFSQARNAAIISVTVLLLMMCPWIFA